MNFSYFISLVSAMMDGLGVVGLVFILTLVLSLPLGLLVMFMEKSRIAPARWIARAFVYVIRGTPLMLQLFIVFYGPLFIYQRATGNQLVHWTRLLAACIAFVINYAAYFSEILRGGYMSIDRGQFEASKVLGLSSSQTFIHVIMPQMFRVALPAITNESVTLLKDTALLYAIAVPEILHYAKAAANRDVSVVPYVIALLIYLVLNTIISWIFSAAEKRVDYKRGRAS